MPFISLLRVVLISCVIGLFHAANSFAAGTQKAEPEVQSLRILQSEPLKIETISAPWDSDLKAWIIQAVTQAVIILLAILGWFLSNRTISRQLDARRREEQREYKYKQLEAEGKLIRQYLDDFYRPYLRLSDTNKKLHDILKAKQSNPKSFRTLIKLLEKYEFSLNDKALVDEIISIGGQLTGLIVEKSGVVDNKSMHNELVEASRHFRILRMANEGKICKEEERFVNFVYPRQLDDKLRDEIEKLEKQLCEIEKRKEILSKEIAKGERGL